MNAVKSFSSFPNGWSVAEAKAGTRYFEVQDVPIFGSELTPNRFKDFWRDQRLHVLYHVRTRPSTAETRVTAVTTSPKAVIEA